MCPLSARTLFRCVTVKQAAATSQIAGVIFAEDGFIWQWDHCVAPPVFDRARLKYLYVLSYW